MQLTLRMHIKIIGTHGLNYLGIKFCLKLCMDMSILLSIVIFKKISAGKIGNDKNRHDSFERYKKITFVTYYQKPKRAYPLVIIGSCFLINCIRQSVSNTEAYPCIHVFKQCSVKLGLNAVAKNIDPRQPAHTA